MLGLGFIGSMSGVLGTALAYLWPVRGSAQGSDLLMVADGPLAPDAVATDTGVVARSRVGKVLVIRTDERLVGVHATCTHLGCTVAWDPESQQVNCPCHGARYNLQGDVLRGPAREPLGRVELREDEQFIRIAASDEA